jgi:anaerobic magnesium-protoporphyrin IX monomethyl ester cyclase
VDELTPENVAFMKARGLFLVYLGIESGTDEGLLRMEKRTTAADNLTAAAVLNRAGVLFDYGFMLFDPGSTFATVRRELDFLDALGGDGSSPVTFCKMLPFAGTAVERRLREQGRLIGPPGHLDYRFEDRRLDGLYALMADSFATWIGDPDGLLNLGRWTRHFLAVYERTFGSTAELDRLAASARRVIGESNLAFTALTRRMTDLCEHVVSGDGHAARLQREAEQQHERYRSELEALITEVAGLPAVPEPARAV